jgi:hypothetical protein
VEVRVQRLEVRNVAKGARVNLGSEKWGTFRLLPVFQREQEVSRGTGGTCSSFPRVEDTDSRTLKVGHIPGRDGQTVHQGCGCDEGVTIGARVRYVKRRASLGDGGINRKDAAGEGGQHVTIHPRTKDRALLFVAAVDEKDSDLQFQ